MVRRLLLPLALTVLLAGATAAPALAAAPGSACGAPGTPSALNEYCQDVPSSTGGSGPGAPGLGRTIPRGTRRALGSAPSGRAVLSLPPRAGVRIAHQRIRGFPISTALPGPRPAPTHHVAKSSIDILGPLLAILAALALATLLAVLIDRRRRRA